MTNKKQWRRCFGIFHKTNPHFIKPMHSYDCDYLRSIASDKDDFVEYIELAALTEAKEEIERLRKQIDDAIFELEELSSAVLGDCIICDVDGVQLGGGWAFKDEAENAQAFLKRMEGE